MQCSASGVKWTFKYDIWSKRCNFVKIRNKYIPTKCRYSFLVMLIPINYPGINVFFVKLMYFGLIRSSTFFFDLSRFILIQSTLAAGRENSVNKKKERKKEFFMMTMAVLTSLKVYLGSISFTRHLSNNCTWRLDCQHCWLQDLLCFLRCRGGRRQF